MVPGRQGDEAIPPDAERRFAARMGADTVEIASNHVAMVSHPDAAVGRIVTAARGGHVTRRSHRYHPCRAAG